MSHALKWILWPALMLTACAQETQNIYSNEMSSRQLLIQSCSGCHRVENESIPPLDNLSSDDLRDSLLAYKNDPNGRSVMHRIMRGYTEDEIEQLSEELGVKP